ncbi:MAG: glycosyltransferase family 2 protein [Candidatus Kerfeldbacteria bacterium]|nr:glycosyltransferase family 2 protein [Candidatus Kerfeldbacteria bacterium]
MPDPVVTMVVVSWNVRRSLRQCLRAAEASRGIRWQIIVVDNASTDGSVDLVRRQFPRVVLIANDINRGFAAAVNQALRRSRGDVLLLNPDLVLQPRTVASMAAWFLRRPRVGIIGPQLIYPDGRLQPSVKRFPRWIDLFLLLSKVPNIVPRLSARYQATDFDYQRIQVVDQVMGSCFLIRRQTLDQVGLFDEQFWIWYEEVDFCRRAKALGWETLYVADAVATHERGQSFRQVSVRRKQLLLRQSIGHYTRKHLGQLQFFGLWPAFAISWLSALVIDFFRWGKPMVASDF